MSTQRLVQEWFYIAALSVIEDWKPRCPSGGEWVHHFVVYQCSGVLLSNKKGQTADTHKNIAESQKYKVNWRKPDTDSTFCMISWHSKTGKID